MLICTITSKILGREIEGNIIEPGQYVSHVHVKMSVASATGDPKGFVKKTISEHLAGCVAESGIPLGERMWDIQFSKFAQSNFNFPEGFTA